LLEALGIGSQIIFEKFHFGILFLGQALIMDFVHQKKGFCRGSAFIHTFAYAGCDHDETG
jgi:hypothetical protein